MKKVTLSAAEIAKLVQGELSGSPERTISSVAGIHEATADQLSFVSKKNYETMLDDAKAGIILICRDLAGSALNDRSLIVCDNVDEAFAKVAALFAEEPPKPYSGIHPSAVVDPSAKLGKNVSVGANAVIEAGVEIGDNTVIGALCYVGHEVKIGCGTLLYPNVTVMYRCVLGSKDILHSGVVIGADGFGFLPTPQGLVKVPQTGYVQIDDDVEIGANTTIDRARFGRTWVKSNVKIDDQVMVAHNVTVGESCILVSQCGIAGSATLGRGVILAAKTGVNGHITLGDGTQVAATSSVIKSLPPNSIAMGTPAEGQREFLTRHSLPKKVAKLDAKIKELEAVIAELKKSSAN